MDQPGEFEAYVSHLARCLVRHVRGYIADDMAGAMQFAPVEKPEIDEAEKSAICSSSDSSTSAVSANQRLFERSRVMNFDKSSPQWFLQLLQVFNILFHDMTTVPEPPKGYSAKYYVIVVCEVRDEGPQRFRIPVAVLIFANVNFEAAPQKSFIYSHFLLTLADQQV